MPGAIPATRKYAERTLPSNRSSKVASSRSAVGPNHEDPGVVDEDVDVADLVDQGSHRRHVVEVGGHEAGPAPLRLDLSDHLGTTIGVAAVDDDLPAVAGQSQGGRSADARGRPGHERRAQSRVGRGARCAHGALP